MFPCDLILSLAALLFADGPGSTTCQDQKEIVTVTVTLEGLSLKQNDWMPEGATSKEKHEATDQAVEKAVVSQLSAEDRLAMWSFKTPGSRHRNATYRITIKCRRNANQLSTSVELKYRQDSIGIPLPPVKTDLDWRPILDAETPEDFAFWLVGRIRVAGQGADQPYESPFDLLVERLSENIPIAHHGDWRDDDEGLFLEIPLPVSKYKYAGKVGFHLEGEWIRKNANHETLRTPRDIYTTPTEDWKESTFIDVREAHIVTTPRFIKATSSCVDVSAIAKEELMQHEPHSVFFIKYEDVWDCDGHSQPEMIHLLGDRQ